MYACVIFSFYFVSTPYEENFLVAETDAKDSSMQAIRAFSYLVLGTGLALCHPPAFSTTTIPGFTPGSLQVSESGAATYTVPIQVAPGRAGLEPKLALVYNSHGGNGYAGAGWNLQGFPTIQRCGRTIIQDGDRRGVAYDANDRYCMNQRLVGVAGPYGSGSPSEYRTERESFTRFYSYGSAGGGPTSFQMQPKSGLWLEFSGRIEAQGKTSVRTWALSRMEDYHGNYMNFTYSEDFTNGEYRPVRVEYTGNEITLAPTFAKVELIWESRPDVIRMNVAGSDIRISQRLKNIRTFVDSKLVRDYRLAYEVGAATGNSRLISVTECSGDGLQCLVAAKFTYSNYSSSGFGLSQTFNGGHGTLAAGWKLADLFADGRQVYYTHDGAGTHQATRATTTGNVTNFSWSGGPHSNGNAGWSTADLFGDGRQMFYTHSTDGTHKATRLNSNGTHTNWTWTAGHGVGNAGWALADFFGDGRQVYYTYTIGGSHQVTRLNSNSTRDLLTWSAPGPSNAANWRSGDLFGDGRHLLFYFSGTTLSAIRLKPDQTYEGPWTWNVPGFAVGSQGWRLADIFGDGRNVFYTNSGNGTHYAVRLNSDGSFDTFNWSGTPLPGNVGWELADILGDGRMVYTTHTSSGTHTAVRFNADNPATFTTWNWTDSIGLGDAGWAMGDMLGTGRSVYFTHSNSGTHQVSAKYPWLTSTIPADTLIRLSTGVGQAANMSVGYGPLTDSAIYTKDANAVYPARDIQVPMYVVRNVSQNDGTGGTQQVDYFYKGAKTHLTGGGFLGFRQIDATSATTGVKASTVFRQDYPFHGLTSSVTKKQASGATLSQATNTWTDTNIPNSTGKYHRSDLTRTVVTANDLNGAAFPTITTDTTYDAYGNALTINVSTSDGFTKVTTNTVSNPVSPSKWIVGRLLRSSVASTKPAPVQTLTRRSAFSYDATTGALTREIIEPDDSNLCLVTTYVHDTYGNKTSATTRNCNGTSSGGVTEAPAPTGNAVFQSRTSTTQSQAGSVTIDGTAYAYPAGQFPTSSTNALNQSETRTFDPRFGGALSLTGPNALTTTWTYDKFGRKATEARADSTNSTFTYAFCGSAPNYCGHSLTAASTGAPTTTTHHDQANRVYRTEVQGFDGTLVRSDTQFDSRGRVFRTSQPYFAGGTPPWTTYTYDALGRVLAQTEPVGGVTIRSYNGPVTSTTNPLGQIDTQTRNSQGQITRVVRQ